MSTNLFYFGLFLTPEYTSLFFQNFVLGLFSIISIAFPVYFLIKNSFYKSGIKIDHFTLFSLGYIYFWVTPLLAKLYYKGYFKGILIAGKNHQLSYGNIQEIFVLINLLYFAFCIGEKISKTSISKNSEIKHLDVILYLYFLILIVLFFFNIDKIKLGFHYQNENIFAKGSLISLNIYAVILHHLKYINSDISVKQYFLNKYFYFVLIITLLVAYFGHRTWIVITVFSYLVMYCYKYKNIRYGILLIFIFLGCLYIAAIPMIRTGQFDKINYTSLKFVFLFDSVGLSLGLDWFWLNNTISLFGNPTILVSKIFDIAPSLVFPEKHKLFASFGELGIDVISPLGGMHNLVNLLVHFGLIGTTLFFFGLPFLIKFLMSKALFRGAAITLSALVAIPMFRDFDNFFIKQFLQMCILMPIIYAIISMGIDKLFKILTQRGKQTVK